MENVTPTVYAAAIQTYNQLGLVPKFDPGATFNDYLGVFGGDTLTATDRYTTGYMSIGIGGHTNETGPDGFPLGGSNVHQPGDTRAFKPFPFIMRLITDGLNIEQRKKYRGRRIETHQGRQYECWYLRVIDKTPLQVNKWRQINSNGQTSTVLFTPNDENINPVPVTPTTSTGSTIQATGDFLYTSCVYNFVLDENDAAELRNCAEIIYNNERYAVISEVVIQAGADRLKTGPGPGQTTMNYTEAVCVQPMAFLVTESSMVVNNKGYTWTIDLGATEPLASAT